MTTWCIRTATAAVAVGLLCWVSCAAGAETPPVQVALARDSRAQLPIVVSARASDARRRVAVELADYLRRMTGAAFEVTAGDGTRGIVLGTLAEFPNPTLSPRLETWNTCISHQPTCCDVTFPSARSGSTALAAARPLYYFSVWLWDWDMPPGGRGANLKYIREQIPRYVTCGATSVDCESGNNWGVHGLGYYVANRLLWNPQADVDALLADFFQQAFGPAATPVRRYYERLDPGNEPLVSDWFEFNDQAAGWGLAVPAGRPVSLALRRGARPAHMGHMQRMFFFVPRGTRALQYYWDGHPHEVYGPDGKLVANIETPSTFVTVPVPAEADGEVWSLNKLCLGRLWFFNVPNYLAASPDALLVPHSAAKE